MASLTGQQMVDEVKNNLGNRSDIGDTRVLRFLNLVQGRLARLFDFNELVNVSIGDATTNPRAVDGTRSYSLSSILSSSSVDRIMEVRRTSNGARIDNMLPRPQDERPKPQAEVWPVRAFGAYIQSGDSLYILQTPDTDDGLFIRWKSLPTDLTLPTTSDLVQRDDILIALATAWAAMGVGAEALHGAWLDKARGLMQTDLAQVPAAIDTLQADMAKQGIQIGRANV